MKRLLLPVLVTALSSLPARALVDGDSDGMSDLWETMFSFSTTSHTDNPPDPAQDPSADPDGDGWTNLQEATAGTDPNDGNPPVGLVRPEISFTPATFDESDGPVGFAPVVIDPPVVTLTWPTIAGKTYQVSVSENLADWTPASDIYMGSCIAQTFRSENIYADGTIPTKIFMRVVIGDTDSDGDDLNDWEEGETDTDPFSPDTDRDGIFDGADSDSGSFSNPDLQATSATYADPDVPGLPASLENGLIARWDFEQIVAAPFTPPFNNPFRYVDTSGNDRHLVPFAAIDQQAGMPSVGTKMTAASGSFLCPPRELLHNRVRYSVSMWTSIDPGSIQVTNFPLAPPAALFSHHKKEFYTNPQTQQTSAFFYRVWVDGLWIERDSSGQQTIKAGTCTYSNHDNGVPNSGNTTYSGVAVVKPAGTFDDGGFHHYLLVRDDAAISLYRDGELLGTGSAIRAQIQGPGETQVGVSIGRFAGEPYENGPIPIIEPGIKASFDRVRVWNRPVTAAEAESLYKQDVDNDGLWDITESRTRLWRDLNSDTLRTHDENSFSSHPLEWQTAVHDTDGDGLSDIREQNETLTGIHSPDTDGDLIPDGWETDNGLDPNDPSDSGLDRDGDGLDNFNEYLNATDPHDPNSDGGLAEHPDNVNDGDEVASGSDPNDPTDGGQQRPAAERLTINLGIGDKSGSKSEDYVMHIHRIDPETGAEIRFKTFRSGGFGQCREEPLSIFRKGETYTFQIDWQATNNDSQPASGGTSAEGPDFDYTFKVEPQGEYLGKLIPSWDSRTGSLLHPSPLAATAASDVAATEAEFNANFESRRIAIVAPKLEWQAIAGFENLDTHIDPWSTTNYQGNDNPLDYYSTANTGQFWNGQTRTWGSATSNAKFDQQGQAVFDFKVGMQPGSNYRIAASVGDQQEYAHIQIENLYEDDTCIGPELDQTANAIVSEPLTVWRRLWVENDSMAAIPVDQFGYKRNDLGSDIDPRILGVSFDAPTSKTTFRITPLSDISSFQILDNGKILISFLFEVDGAASVQKTPADSVIYSLRLTFDLYKKLTAIIRRASKI